MDLDQLKKVASLRDKQNHQLDDVRAELLKEITVLKKKGKEHNHKTNQKISSLERMMKSEN